MEGSGKTASFVKEITRKSEDISRWYTDVILKAEIADYAPMKGMMVIRPYGYAIWELMQAALDRRIKETGHQNAYFPLLIPQSFLQKEAQHVEGFAPEVAWVTRGGDEELAEPLAIRPTSEAIIGYMYSRWIQSYRDLPLLINQWANVLRWEKETRFFLRTTEFLWQEGHTVHATEAEAEEETLRMLGVYEEFALTELAVPVLSGLKTEREKFAGALRTYAIEAVMPDGKALQAGTSHNLGQNFAHAFDITFLDRDGTHKHAWTTSWGVSTRLMGALIMTHGDDHGLILPPRVAPYQVVIVPIGRPGGPDDAVAAAVDRAVTGLRAAGIRVTVDRRAEQTVGWKFNEWELRGVPLRLEMGRREAAAGQALLVRRDNRERVTVSLDQLPTEVAALLESIQANLLERARETIRTKTSIAHNYDDFRRLLDEKPGLIVAPWCGDSECEDRIKAETTATIRCMPSTGEIAEMKPQGPCLCGQPAKRMVIFARAY